MNPRDLEIDVNQSIWNMLIHVVFSTKLQQANIPEVFQDDLYKYIAEVLTDKPYSPAMTVGGAADHIHILFAQSRLWSIESIVQHVKSKSAEWMRAKGSEFKDFDWQLGYGAFSISRSSAWSLKEYISEQKKFHATNSYKEEFVQLLDAHKIEYDLTAKDFWD